MIKMSAVLDIDVRDKFKQIQSATSLLPLYLTTTYTFPLHSIISSINNRFYGKQTPSLENPYLITFRGNNIKSLKLSFESETSRPETIKFVLGKYAIIAVRSEYIDYIDYFNGAGTKFIFKLTDEPIGLSPEIVQVSRIFSRDGEAYDWSSNYIYTELSETNGVIEGAIYVSHRIPDAGFYTYDYLAVEITVKEYVTTVVDIKSNDTEFDLPSLFKKNNIDVFSIEISDWVSSSSYFNILATDNYPTELVINQQNLIELNSPVFDREDLNLPNFGIISNSGNIRFNDIYDPISKQWIIESLADRNLLGEGVKCNIYLTNTLTGVSELVNQFETATWTYDNDNREANVTIKDDLEEWQDINVEGINYDPRDITPLSLADFYDYLHLETIKNGFKMKQRTHLKDKTQSKLQEIMVKYPLLKSGNLWSQWNKLCVAAQAHIYSDKGEITFVYNGGN